MGCLSFALVLATCLLTVPWTVGWLFASAPPRLPAALRPFVEINTLRANQRLLSFTTSSLKLSSSITDDLIDPPQHSSSNNNSDNDNTTTAEQGEGQRPKLKQPNLVNEIKQLLKDVFAGDDGKELFLTLLNAALIGYLLGVGFDLIFKNKEAVRTGVLALAVKATDQIKSRLGK
jgi:hypothetical protein